MSSAEAIALEDKYGAHNYHPLPVVLSRGRRRLCLGRRRKEILRFPFGLFCSIKSRTLPSKIVGAMVEQNKNVNFNIKSILQR